MALKQLLDNYLSEESGEEEEEPMKKKRKRSEDEIMDPKNLLPVPPNIFKMFSDEKDTENNQDSSLHDGRIRTFPHQRGDWASYVYIPYSSSSTFSCMLDSVMELSSNEGLNLSLVEDFHISLSRVFVMQLHQINVMSDGIKSALAHHKCFTVNFDMIEVYINEEKTRTFVGLKVENQQYLHKMLSSVDKCLEDFNLPKFYDDPSFHMSIAWCLGDQSAQLKQHIDKLQDIFTEEYPGLLKIDKVCFKSGNKLFSYPLA